MHTPMVMSTQHWSLGHVIAVITLPVLAIGVDHSYGAHLATEIGFAASNVRSAVINNLGHWIMEEQPQQAIAVIIPFLEET